MKEKNSYEEVNAIANECSKEMLTRIQQHKAIFEVEKYNKKAMPEVLEYLKRAKERNGGKTVYNAELTSEIMEKENLPEDYRDYINKEVYLAQHDYEAEKEAEHKAKMIAEGWKPLTNKTEYTGKCQYIATKLVDWFTTKLENTGTIKRLGNGELFLVPKGRRSSGYYVRNLDNAFYKVI